MNDAEVYEIKKIKFGRKRWTNFNNLWIDCQLQLGSWSEMEKANKDYIEEIVNKFKKYVSEFNIKEAEID